MFFLFVRGLENLHDRFSRIRNLPGHSWGIYGVILISTGECPEPPFCSCNFKPHTNTESLDSGKQLVVHFSNFLSFLQSSSVSFPTKDQIYLCKSPSYKVVVRSLGLIGSFFLGVNL